MESALLLADVFAAGVHSPQKVMSQMSIWAPAASVGLMVAGIVIEVCFALMAAFMVLALVESYLVISMGVIFMAFGGSRWTKDLAVSTVRYTVSVGAKLFVLQLLVSIGTGLITAWAATFNDVTAALALHSDWLLDRHAGSREGAAGDDAAHRERLQHGELAQRWLARPRPWGALSALGAAGMARAGPMVGQRASARRRTGRCG